MRSKPEIFALQAAECRRKAAVATDRMQKWLFSDLAVQWLELAATERSLEAEKKEWEHFFKGGSPIRTTSAPRGGGERGSGRRERVLTGTIARPSTSPGSDER